MPQESRTEDNDSAPPVPGTEDAGWPPGVEDSYARLKHALASDERYRSIYRRLPVPNYTPPPPEAELAARVLRALPEADARRLREAYGPNFWTKAGRRKVWDDKTAIQDWFEPLVGRTAVEVLGEARYQAITFADALARAPAEVANAIAEWLTSEQGVTLAEDELWADIRWKASRHDDAIVPIPDAKLVERLEEAKREREEVEHRLAGASPLWLVVWSLARSSDIEAKLLNTVVSGDVDRREVAAVAVVRQAELALVVAARELERSFSEGDAFVTWAFAQSLASDVFGHEAVAEVATKRLKRRYTGSPRQVAAGVLSAFALVIGIAAAVLSGGAAAFAAGAAGVFGVTAGSLEIADVLERRQALGNLSIALGVARRKPGLFLPAFLLLLELAPILGPLKRAAGKLKRVRLRKMHAARAEELAPGSLPMAPGMAKKDAADFTEQLRQKGNAAETSESRLGNSDVADARGTGASSNSVDGSEGARGRRGVASDAEILASERRRLKKELNGLREPKAQQLLSEMYRKPLRSEKAKIKRRLKNTAAREKAGDREELERRVADIERLLEAKVPPDPRVLAAYSQKKERLRRELLDVKQTERYASAGGTSLPTGAREIVEDLIGHELGVQIIGVRRTNLQSFDGVIAQRNGKFRPVQVKSADSTLITHDADLMSRNAESFLKSALKSGVNKGRRQLAETLKVSADDLVDDAVTLYLVRLSPKRPADAVVSRFAHEVRSRLQGGGLVEDLRKNGLRVDVEFVFASPDTVFDAFSMSKIPAFQSAAERLSPAAVEVARERSTQPTD